MRFPTFTVIFLATAIGVLLPSINSSQAWGQQDARPNIILLNLDDADTDLLSIETVNQHFPALAELYQRSTVFTNAHSTTPFCAPSRAALFTGKYGFNNGCKTGSETAASSVGFDGGYQRFRTLGHDENELGVWMKQAGYRTMHVGKFHHNGFDFQVPSGWNDFSVDLGARFFGTSRFSNINRQTAERYRIAETDYITTEEYREASMALAKHARRRPNIPFFLYLAPIAPHFPSVSDLSQMADVKYKTYAEGLLQPTDAPDFDEADISDKPAFLQRGRLSASEKVHLQDAFIHRLRSMKSVDDMVGDLVAQLKKSGHWDNTYFFLTSDNGYSLGHHRTLYKKGPYARSSGIPLIALGPASQSQHIASHLIAHIDICPTILELAGAEVPEDLDGKSFADLIESPDAHSASAWQHSIMIENWADKYVQRGFIPMSYTAERFFDKIHIAWSNGEHEYYHLGEDPFQLENIYGSLSGAKKQSLNTSLLGFRKQDVVPNITLTSPISGTAVERTMAFAGYMEDNSVPVLARLTVKSYLTDKFFNGNSWQREHVSIPIAPASLTSSINIWDHDLKIFSETSSDFDVFVSWVTPMDDSLQTGPIKFTVNSLKDSSILATINPTISGRTYQSPTQQIVGFHGRYPDQKVSFFIVDTQTSKYFNGQTMQDDFVVIDADSLPNRRWSKTVSLPPGHYRCRAFASAGNLFQTERSTAEFTVQ